MMTPVSLFLGVFDPREKQAQILRFSKKKKKSFNVFKFVFKRNFCPISKTTKTMFTKRVRKAKQLEFRLNISFQVI